MKNVFQLLVVMLLPLSMLAQLSGTLSDKSTGEKISGAVITIENSYAYAMSDAQGHFSFDHINEKSMILHVHHIAYELLTQTVTLPENDLKLMLQPRNIISDEVTVTATRAGSQSAMAYTNVSKEEIAKNNLGQDLPYLLNLTPSVVTTSDAGSGIGYTGIRIRGSDATRVNVTINGIPVNDAEAHAVYWVDLPDFASSIDNIQIQRGVGTSTNGAGAFGGSVNIQSSNMSPVPFAEVNTSYGSFNSWKNTVTFGSGLLDNKFAFDGRLSKITSDGYIDRATADLKSFYLSGGYYGSKSTLRVVLFSGKEKTYQAWNGVPEEKLRGNKDTLTNFYNNNVGYLFYTPQDSINLFNSNNRTYNSFTYQNQTDNYQQDYYQLLYSYAVRQRTDSTGRTTSKLNLNAALHYTKGYGYYEEYHPQQLFSNYNLNNPVIGNDTLTTTDLIRQLWLDNDFYGFTYSANYESGDLKFTLGGAGNRYTGRHYDQVIWAQNFSNGTYPWIYDDNNATKNDFNTFLKGIYSVNHSLHIYGDLQYRAVSYSFLGKDFSENNIQQQVSLNFFNPKGGVTYDLNARSNVYASVAVAHKEPIRDDYIDFSPLRPKPEQMTDWEAGYKFSGNKVRINANFYFMNYQDQLILTGKLNDVGAYIRQNVDQSYREGIELEAGWSILKNLTVSANFTYSQNKIKTYDEYLYDYATYDTIVKTHNNTDIAFSPSVIGAGIISYSPIKNFTIGFDTKYVGKQYLDNTSDETRKLDAYLVNNLHINYNIHSSLFKALELKFAINNLFDRQFESNGATYPYYSNGTLFNSNYYFPQAGRNYFGGVSIRF